MKRSILRKKLLHQQVKTTTPPANPTTLSSPTAFLPALIDCMCKNKKIACGSSFPAGCKLEADRLYDCSASGVSPAAGEMCPQGCTTQSGDTIPDKCKKSDCSCQKAKTLCGRSMQSGCNFSNHSIYDCTKGVGSTPVLQKLCVPGTTCLETAEGASCGGSKCTCTGDLSVCSNQFPDGCGLKKNAVYKCTPSGRPVLDKDCAGDQSCVSVISGATCASNDCKCAEDGSVCGRKFPPSCNLNASSVYTCHTGDSPVLETPCSPGYCDVTTPNASPSTDKCLDTCTCPSADFMCGSTFAEECGLDAGSLYKCTASGIAPMLEQKCTDGQCTANMGPDICGTAAEPSSRCFCNSTASICGSSLDPKCDSVLGEPVDSNSTYTCSGDGQKPVKGKKCTVDEVCTEESTGAQCKSLCTCTGTDIKCSKDFPAACHLPEGAYKCGVDGKPQKEQDCVGTDVCVDNVCTPPECLCKNNNSRCSSTFPDKCGFLLNAVYDCQAPGERPIPPVGSCGSGVCSADVLPPDPSHSISDVCIKQCECKEAGTAVCASTFAPICGYDSKVLMSCGKLGDIPTLQENCTLSCEDKTGALDACKFDPCACSVAGDVCGSSFPDTCRYEAQSIYSCKTATALPEKKTACTVKEVCVKSPAGPACTPEDCICKDDVGHCGSTFVDACSLKKDTLYKCAIGSLPTVDHDCAPGICSANIVAGLAVFRATAIDSCIDQCACKESNVLVCGSVFDASCNYKAKDLMECKNVGDVPTVKESCTASCTAQAGPDVCALDPCACSKAGNTCDSVFPDICNYEKDTQYTCSGIKALPVKKAVCPTANVCLVNATGSVCTPPECICKDDASHCGSTFAAPCNLDSNTLYKCAIGALPTLLKDCGPGTCSTNVVAGSAAFEALADDSCIDQCACKEASIPVCASSFDSSCSYGNKSLMACVNAGDVPTVKEACTLSCTAQAGPDVCTLDPCACTKVGDACSGSFPAACGLEKDTVYSCAGDKVLPTKKEACIAVTACIETSSGPTCTPQDCICKDDGSHCGSTFVDACNLQKNALYKCTNGGVPSLDKDCGTGTCSANVVKGTAEFRATADDKCIDQCACKEAGISVCGGAFDPICAYDTKALMDCASVADVPTIKENCTLSCDKKAGPDECTLDPCACTTTGDTCSNTFSSTCTYEKDSVYTCASPRKLPTKKEACPSPQACLVTPSGPVCTAGDCICKDDGSHCGSTFLDSCKLQKNSLYKCTSGGLPSLVEDCGTGTCSANVIKGAAIFRATADDTCINQCACKEANVAVCSSIFDPICNYKAKDLMECTAVGDVPTVKESCTGSCTTQPGSDVCALDSCACTKAGDICSQTFPATCGYKSETVYSCSGNKALPTEKAPCKVGTVCLTTASGPTCTPPDCICKDGGSHCGSTFVDTCSLQNNTLYKCTNGQLPTVVKDCGTGTCSANVVKGMAEFRATADDTCIDQCACKEADVPICASGFDSTCNYDSKTLMECGNVGDVPTVKEACTLSCTKQAGPDVCTLDPCACTKIGDACGSTLPPNCGYEKDSVYTCSAIKALPQKKSACDSGKVCLEISTGPTCTSPDCICKDDGSHCGSTFVDTCTLQKNALYKCKNGGAPSLEKDCGTGTCSANVVKGTAEFRATADDTCIDQCACKEANVPVCASAFDTVCNYKDKDLMACGGAGDVPTILDACTLSCTKQPGPDVCTLDPCACTKAGDTCGGIFSNTCGYENNTRYSCAGERKLPVKKDACPAGKVCLKTGTLEPVCASPECICKDNDSHCGSRYPAVCGFQSETLFKCTLNALPVPVRDCTPGVCSANIASGTAVFTAQAASDICVDQCACKETGVSVCANTFDPSCNYDNKALLACAKVGDIPTVKETCTLSCTAQAGPDVCTLNPCACTKAGDVCGNSLDPTCGYEKTSVYTCGGNKMLPTKKDACPTATICLEINSGPTCTPPDCVCKDDGSHCGSTFIPACKLESNTLYKCASGALPSSAKDCTPGTCSANVVAGLAVFRAMADDNCIDQCACKEANVPICASTFDPVCNYGNKSLMACGNVGDVPTLMDACTNSCTKQPGPDVCTFDPCACTKAGDACGSTLPPNCGYEKDSVYTCTTINATPQKKSACESGKVCHKIPTGPTCTSPDCICKDDGSHCGSTFVDACNLQKNALYKCTNGGVPSLDKDCGTGTCSANVVKGTAEFRATADDTCIDQCACKEANVPICASAFDAVCNYKEKDLMACGGPGDVPTVAESCTLSCTKQAGPDFCTLNPCACTRAGDVCGSTLPLNCGYEKDSVYTCAGERKSPVKKAVCASTDICLEAPTGANCLPKDCVCKDDHAHCGSTFAPICGLQSNTLYRCNTGAASTVAEDCGLGTCSANALNPPDSFKALPDNFCIDECKCSVFNQTVCASTFDASCNFNAKDLMACKNINDTPTVAETCTKSCSRLDGADECEYNPCACPVAGDTCGSEFPVTCSYELNTQYNCSKAKALPVKNTPCPDAHVCLFTSTGTFCTPPDCICRGDGYHCGSFFSSDCSLKNNSLYKCDDEALPMLVKDCDPGTCSRNVITGAPATTSNDKCLDLCTCKEANVSVCASTFDPSCNYDNKSLMVCGNEGDVPTVKEECSVSCTKQFGPDVCTLDPCACTKAGDACGSTLPPNCGYEKDSVYTCTTINATPQKKSACESGKVCHEIPTGPTCTSSDCICKDDGSHCGSTFVDACNLQKNALYKCTNGGVPSLDKDCGTGTCSANVVKGTAEFRATADDTCIDQCACKEAGVPICASGFDSTCNYDSKTLMECGNVGDVPTVKEACTLSCTKQAGPDVCTLDPCACTKIGDACGSTLPPNCGYEKDSVYTCSAIKALPQKKSACDSGKVCLEISTGPTCTSPDCICKDDGSHCGSTFVDTCTLQKNALYKCTNGSVPSLVKDCGAGTCSANVVKGTAEFRATADDTCIDQCACKEANVPVCASAFDTVCNYKEKDLMTCGGAGDVPTIAESCTLSCTKQPGPDVCTLDPCACTKAEETCGSAFPASCTKEVNSQYTCAGNKALPVKKTACPAGNVCLATTTGSVCTPSECICKDDISHCGSTFPPTCNLRSNTLYKCTNGQLPTLVKDCGTGTCSANVVAGTGAFAALAEDKCLDVCVCKEANVPVCASVFDSSCNYGNKSLMDCGNAGDVPTVKEQCTLSCTKQSGPDVCTLDPCACTKAGDACGSIFPDICGYEKNSRYSCAGERKLPVKSAACASTETCQKAPTGASCLPNDCLCKDDHAHCGSTFAPICGLQSNTLYRCSKGAASTVAEDCGLGTCSANALNPPDSFKALPDNFCIDKCKCSVFNQTVCASTFDASCNFNAKDLMACKNINDTPTVAETCTKSCSKLGSRQECELDSCACPAAGDTCGSAFAVTCSYELNTQYTCSGPKVLPFKSTPCPDAHICFLTSTGTFCTPPECICMGDGEHCGSVFSPGCNLKNNSLYKCVDEALPMLVKDCDPGTCSRNVIAASSVVNTGIYSTPEFNPKSFDKCLDLCSCKESNVSVCASTFDSSCNYGNKSLMVCGNEGDVPTVKEACTLSCTKQLGPDVCTLDPCACSRVGDTCGRAFPANCGYLTDSLYTCAAIRTLPVKKSNCRSSEICQTVPGGVDVCVVNDVCDCVGTGTVCTDQFPAKCAKPANSVVTCPAGTVTACPNGCAAAECKATGCSCVDNSDRCGSSFSPACNFMPNALYACDNGQAPVLKSDCGTQTCVKSSTNAACQDPCKCGGLKPVCGSAYPTSCGLLKDTFYNCPAIGVAPVAVSACTAGCYASQPNASCKKECATAVTAATAQITRVTAAMTALIPSNNITKVVYPPLIAVLNDVATDLTKAKDDLKALALIASTSGDTVEDALQLLTTAQTEFKAFDFPTSVALNNSLPDLQASIRNVVSCAGISTTDCSGVLSLYRRIAADAKTEATQTPAAVTKDMTTQLANITSALEKTLTTSDTMTLQATGQAFGALIGQTMGNAAKYGDFSYSLIFMNDAFGQVLKCEGMNETLFADKCALYRMQGVLGDFIQFFQDNLGSIPVVGPLIINPLLVLLKAYVIDLQRSGATAVGGIASVFYGILQMIKIVSPGDQTNPIRDYILRLVGLLDVPTECAGGVSPCTGLIQIVMMLGEAVINLISQIPVVGYMIGVTLNPILDGLLKALTSGTSAVINTSYNALNSALKVVEIMPFFGNIATPFRYLLDATKVIVDCMTTGSSSTTSFQVEEGAVEKMEKVEIIEQPEKMLAKV